MTWISCQYKDGAFVKRFPTEWAEVDATRCAAMKANILREPQKPCKIDDRVPTRSYGYPTTIDLIKADWELAWREFKDP